MNYRIIIEIKTDNIGETVESLKQYGIIKEVIFVSIRQGGDNYEKAQ